MKTIARAVFALMTTACASLAEAQSMSLPYQFEIDRVSLAEALNSFSKQTGFSVSKMRGSGDRLVGPLKGRYTAEDALEQLLRSNGFDYTVVEPGIIAVIDSDTLPQRGTVPVVSPTRFGKESTSQGQSRSAPAPATTAENNTAAQRDVEEVIVTAQKRAERLQDVPVPVTVIGASALVSSNQVRVQDYFSKVPGLNLTPSVQSAQNLSVRGITTGFANPTVGVTIDDVPYGSSLGVAGGLQVPDIDPSELARVEVLRGPQGTLYGASSMGGLFKFVTIDPSTESFSGRAQGAVIGVRNGDDVGYSLRGSLNMPLGDTFAVRASGFTRHDPGYIDNVQTGEKGVNTADVNGARLSALWRLSDSIFLKLGAMYQKAEGDGAAEVDDLSGLGDLQQDRLRGTGWYDRELQAYSAVFTADIGAAELTSVSGYSIHEVADTFDFTYGFGPITEARFGVRGTPLRNDYSTDKFTQELRFTTPLGSRVEWLVGGFYANEDTTFGQTIQAADPATGALVGQFYTFDRPYRITEYAGFTNLTVNVTDRFDVQFGGRQSRIEQSSGPTDSLGFPPFGNGVPAVSPKLTAEPDNVFTYLVTPRFKVSPDLMMYARLASGYRAGGGGTSGPADRCVTFNFPCQYEADKTLNYELGMKGRVFDQALSFDASVYYIDWQDIQIQVLHQQSNTTYNTNGSGARSQGVEVSVESSPLDGMTLSAWVAYNDAELTEAFPPGPVRGVNGDRLPLSSRMSGNLSLDQEFQLASDLTGSIGTAITYMGSRMGLFTGASSARAKYPDYARVDLRATLRRELWTLDFFVNNVTDKRAQLSGGPGFNPPFSIIYIQPRTIGMSLVRTF